MSLSQENFQHGSASLEAVGRFQVLRSSGENYAAWRLRVRAELGPFLEGESSPAAPSTGIFKREELGSGTGPMGDGKTSADRETKTTTGQSFSSPSASEALMAKRMLLRWIDDSLVIEFGHLPSAKAIFDALERKFLRLLRPLAAAKRRALQNIRSLSFPTMEAYIQEVGRLVMELREGAGMDTKEEEHISYLLDGLDGYDHLRLALESSLNLELEVVKVRLLQEAARKELAGKTGGGHGGKGAAGGQALFADKPPEPKNKGGAAFKGKCFNCGKSGHKASSCRSKPKKDGRGDDSKNGAPRASGRAEKSFYLHQALMSHECEQEEQDGLPVKRENLRVVWWVDSGASNHYTSRREILHNLRPLERPQAVQLAMVGHKNVAREVGEFYGESPEGVPIVISPVYLLDHKSPDLLSVASIIKKGGEVVFKQEEATLTIGEPPVTINFQKSSSGLWQLRARALPAHAAADREGELKSFCVMLVWRTRTCCGICGLGTQGKARRRRLESLDRCHSAMDARLESSRSRPSPAQPPLAPNHVPCSTAFTWTPSAPWMYLPSPGSVTVSSWWIRAAGMSGCCW